MSKGLKDGYCVMYLRKSRADVEKERLGRFETLAIHEKQLAELAAREGYHVAEVYRELVSGESIAERRRFQEVMDRISDEDCTGVIVHAIDRLGRGDPMEYGWILSAFKWSNTLIITPNRVYNPGNADDLQQLKLQMFVSNIEFEHIRERLHDGSRRSAERGNYIGSKPPYGYDKAIIDRRSTLVPNGEAPVVRTIFEMAAKGINKGAISRHLNASGISTRHGGIWVSSRVGTIVSNPVYKGFVRFGYTKQRVVARDGMKLVKKTVKSKEGDYILAKGVHEPLVSEEQWEMANRKAFEGVPVKRDKAIKNPLAGLIVCGRCGRALIRQDVVNKYGDHYPRLHHAYNTECQCKSVRLDYVVECLCDALKQVASDLETGIIECGVNPAEIESVERCLASEERRLDKLMELFYADAITISEFKSRRAASNDLIKRMTAKRDELLSKNVDKGEIVFSTHEALSLLCDPSVSAEKKNDTLKAFIERIEYEEINQARTNRQIKLTVRLRFV